MALPCATSYIFSIFSCFANTREGSIDKKIGLCFKRASCYVGGSNNAAINSSCRLRHCSSSFHFGPWRVVSLVPPKSSPYWARQYWYRWYFSFISLKLNFQNFVEDARNMTSFPAGVHPSRGRDWVPTLLMQTSNMAPEWKPKQATNFRCRTPLR